MVPVTADLLDASARFLVESGARGTGREAAPATASSPIPPVWFFGLFLACAALLWSKRRAG